MLDHLDHLVLTATDADATTHFYVEVLGMRLETFGKGRKAFCFGDLARAEAVAGDGPRPSGSRRWG